MNLQRLLIVAIVTGLVGAAVGTAAAEGPPRKDTVPVTWHAQAVTFEDHEAGAVEGASASLVATASGATMRMQTRELEPGHAYTLWYVFVDNPEACNNTPCNAADFFTNPDVDAQVTYGAGHVVGNSGRGTFTAHLSADPVEGWLPDRSLDNPLGAEYHAVLNDHGPKLAAHMPGMIRTYRGGCSDDSPFPPIFPDTALADGEPGPNRCLLTQVAVFLP